MGYYSLNLVINPTIRLGQQYWTTAYGLVAVQSKEKLNMPIVGTVDLVSVVQSFWVHSGIAMPLGFSPRSLAHIVRDI